MQIQIIDTTETFLRWRTRTKLNKSQLIHLQTILNCNLNVEFQFPYLSNTQDAMVQRGNYKSSMSCSH
jgi:hypothetical protein